ncbi:MAG: helix-turn-helix transcriptional regulator [Microbacteriaceae bacterium]|nr:helix-turn-helix transcriptional regulator [Microbacteriaceae bacterium]
MAADTEADAQAIARALSSPLRLRVLRLCAHTARTNKELATLLGVNPGTMLHHVCTRVRT